MLLHPHNQETYRTMLQLFQTHNRVAAVQPTGTGKSFLMLQWIYDNPEKNFLITSPSTYIFSQIQTHAENYHISTQNCDFLTYTRLSSMLPEELYTQKWDAIILDEFHRCGAAEWSKGVENLLQAFPNAKIFGTSATPIRYLDSFRNMAEELFDNCYAVNMSLAEAIGRKILPLPIYVTGWYSFRGDIARLQKKVEISGNPYFRRVLFEKIQKARSMVADMDCGLDTIFARHMKKTSGKYIVFCANTERLQQAVEESVVWFQKVNTNIHSYQVFSQNNQSEQQFEAFRDDVDPTALKLLFSVNMLNEGVHVDGIDGVIMLRATQSANVFYQQLGRALSCSTGKQPVIFDIVNNFETGDTAKQYAEMMEIGREKGTGQVFDIQFELYDYVRDIRELLSDLRNTFEDSWEVVYEVLKEYIEKHQNFPVYAEEYAGYKLGVWCSNQRILRSTGNLSSERIEKLNQSSFIWDAKDERWNNSFQLVWKYKKKHGKLPVRTDTSDDAGSIYQWISNQKQLYKKGKLSEERRLALKSLGISVASKSSDELWEENYTILCQFLSECGRFPASSDCKERAEIYPVYRWISKQRKAYKDGTLSQKRMTQLNQIGFVWDKAEALWNERFEILKKFVRENGRTPTAREKYGADCIGQWYYKQLRYCQDGKLEEGKRKKLDSLTERRIVKSGKFLPCVRSQELRN